MRTQRKGGTPKKVQRVFSAWTQGPPKPVKFTSKSHQPVPEKPKPVYQVRATAIVTTPSAPAFHSATPRADKGVEPVSRRFPARPPLSTRVLMPQGSNRIQMTAVLPIHNRSLLLKRALDGYLWQTLLRDRWEILLLDDMSTEDLRLTYHHLVGRMNLRHVRVDHTRHPIYREMNPPSAPPGPPRWYHTPAITMNIGFQMARGSTLCICHPEILHSPTNFETAIGLLRRRNAFLFGTTYLGTQETNRILDAQPDWTSLGWSGFLDSVSGGSMATYGYECYWYTSFLPKAAAIAIGGVDLAYMKGVAGEDDDFRERVKRAGWEPVHDPRVEGLHQDHSHETERHRRRDTPEWEEGLVRNRAIYQRRKVSDKWPSPSNSNTDWSCTGCVVEELRWTIGSSVPEIVRHQATPR